jgi:hypothetical protein
MKSSASLRALMGAAVIVLSSMLASPIVKAQGRDPKHDFEVREAIKAGADALIKDLGRLLKKAPGDYPMGRLSLCLTALLETGISTKYSLVKNTLSALEDLPLEKTYSVSCYLFALDAYWQQKVREEAATATDGDSAGSPTATGRIREKLETLVEWIVSARREKKGAWGYEELPGAIDNSNTQFAVLGLGIAIKHGIEIDGKVFVEIAKYLVKSHQREGKRFRLRLTPETPFGPITTPGKTEATTIDVMPGGWPYTQGLPIPSMTAAGASNLLIARDGLQRLGRGNSKIVSDLERALRSSLGWISSQLSAYIDHSGSYYYTLYSLEKVGDLGGIREFNGRDWYYEGCRALLERQAPDGSWGGRASSTHVDTSFALLFLTRATRPYQEVESAPKIFTGPDRPDAPESKGRVYVDSIDGFISAREFFYYLSRRRDRKTIKIGEQVVNNYASDRREELIPLLVMVWGRHSDAAAQFARDALQTITGVRKDDREFYLKWHRDAQSVSALYKSAKKDPVEIGRVLRQCEGLALKTRILDIIERERLAETCLDLVDELLSKDDAHRRRVHALLQQFTNVTVSAPESKSLREWKPVHARWSEWVNGETGRILFRSARIRRTVAIINRPDRDEAATRNNIEELVQFGRDALPEIMETMKSGSFCADLVVALERLSGEYHGVNVEAWEQWWERNQ